MTDAEFQDYFDKRFTEYINFYDTRSKHNKTGHYFCSIYNIVVPVLAVIIAGISIARPTWAQWLPVKATIIALITGTVAIVTGITSFCRFHENWLRYRSVWDALSHEPQLRLAKVKAYATAADRNALFVERVEDIISSEGADWLSCHKPKDESASKE